MANPLPQCMLPDVTQDTYIFMCSNRREGRKACGNDVETEALCEYFKQTVQRNRPLLRPGRIVKVNKTGCLGRCANGPNMVIFPENIWYRYATQEDIDVIVKEHLIQGRAVARLMTCPLRAHHP